MIISTISNERGEELLYADMRISDVFKENIGIGGVISLLWFKRRLPPWATKFIEMVLMLIADHGPAVSGHVTHLVVIMLRGAHQLYFCQSDEYHCHLACRERLGLVPLLRSVDHWQ